MLSNLLFRMRVIVLDLDETLKLYAFIISIGLHGLHFLTFLIRSSYRADGGMVHNEERLSSLGNIQHKHTHLLLSKSPWVKGKTLPAFFSHIFEEYLS